MNTTIETIKCDCGTDFQWDTTDLLLGELVAKSEFLSLVAEDEPAGLFPVFLQTGD